MAQLQMDSRFLSHNTHLEDAKRFVELDFQLRQLYRQPYVHIPALLNQLPLNIEGIYTLGGGRQVGKTTLLKQWMEKLLLAGVAPAAIAFFTGELIDNHHTLLHLLQAQLANMPTDRMKYIILDEVTYIQDWDKGIKYAADAGWLENVILILTGSDLVLIQEARMRFPGRRGTADVANFHLYPLSFREVCDLKYGAQNETESESFIKILTSEFNHYLLHGGYLKAINDIATHGKILESTLITYSDWIRGDMLKRGKQEHYLREICAAIIKRYMSQVTWNALARDLSIDHPKTVADYIALLESMDAVYVQPALLEDKLCAAPKKARKVMFADPFVYHAIKQWIKPAKDFYVSQIAPILNHADECGLLVEATVVTHYRRFYPTYYIKAEGEVDLAYVLNNKFWPIEIKWTNQIRIAELKQALKYSNSRIFTKVQQAKKFDNITSEFLPLALWHLQ